MSKYPLLVTLLALAALIAASACSGSEDGPPLVFAAASLADVLTEAAEAYEERTGESVEFNFGGSTALANQVARLDAPADGVIFAGQSPLVLLSGSQLVVESTVIARNSLVVVSATDTPLSSLDQLASADDRIAIADPDLAPAGQYAREALTSAGLWDSLQDRVIPTLDVRAALAAASSGSAGFAIVYSTDAMTETGLNVVFEISPDLHSPIIYPAAAVTGSGKTDAVERFIDFLVSAEGQGIFAAHGFVTG